MRRTFRLTEASNTQCEITPATAAWLNSLGHASARPLANGQFLVNPGNVCGIFGNGDATFEVAPKTTVRNLLELVLYARTGLSWDPGTVQVEHDPVPLLMAGYLDQVVTEALRAGVLKGYVAVNETSRYMRGRLRFKDQLARRFMQPYPLEVQTTDLSADIAENQILHAALQAMLRVVISEMDKRAEREVMVGRLRRSVAKLGPQTPIHGRIPTWTRTVRNRHYWEALAVAELILEGEGQALAAGSREGAGVIIQTWRIYEAAVARAMREKTDPALDTVSAQYVEPLASNRADRTIRPDIVARYPHGQLLVMDSKFKDKEPQQADLYQSITYSRVLGVEEVVLLYAGERDPAHPVRYEIRQPEHLAGTPRESRCVVTVEYLNLNQDLEGIKQDVWALVDKYDARRIGVE